MQLVDQSLRLSPSDLSGFLGCRHRTGLDLAVVNGKLAKPVQNDAFLRSMRERGLEHERAYVESLRAQGFSIIEIPTIGDMPARAEATRVAMREGVEIVVQAALLNGEWGGYADVLRRVPFPSALGAWSYEPYDTKLARETRGGTILQLAVYADLLEQWQGVCPEHFHVVTPGLGAGDFITHTYRSAEYAAYFRVVRRQLAEAVRLGHDEIQRRHYPDLVEHCDVCRWWDRCNDRRRKDDHLSFIAGAARLHRQELTAQGFPTLAAAAGLPLPVAFTPSRGSRDTYERIAHQARLQHQQRTTRQPVHELLTVEAGKGLGRLPEPSPGDLFLDLEGARFAREGGREYLFGVWSSEGYESYWAFTDAEEQVAFEALTDRIMTAWAAHPGMHIYHFNHYEPTALKRLMGRYATRGEELDRLLRAERFVDLYTVVRQALRAGVESYSIKQLEQFYGFTRAVVLRDASAQLQAIELALESGAVQTLTDDVREAVRGYNQDDCRSTEALRNWLEGLRSDVLARGAEVPRPTPKGDERAEELGEREARQQATRERLLKGLPEEARESGHHQHPLWLLAYLIDWHRREDKSESWEYFRLRDLPEADLLEERKAITGLAFIERVEVVRNVKTRKPTGSVVDRYSYPLQEVELGRRGDLVMPGGVKIGQLVGHDRLNRTIDIRKGPKSADVHPTAVFAKDMVQTVVMQEALLSFAEHPERESCGSDLLFRRPPRVTGEEGRSGRFERHQGEDETEFAVRLASRLDRTTLAIQGPPGAGKTYTGARMICALAQAGKRVGVTANSHKVIRNLLHAVHEQNPTVSLGHKDRDDEDDDGGGSAIREFDDNESAFAALGSGEVSVLGGTAWLWARPEAVGTVDVLFVDEASQMSLANALAVSGATNSLVLLGDPQQLEQPQKGTHPDGVGVSALQHVLASERTMPLDRGLFLPTTWRLHPSICAFTSELFYEAKLHSRAGLEQQRLTGTRAFDGASLWWVPVEHAGNQNHSPEEVDVVEQIVDQLLAPGVQWIDAKGEATQLTAADLRIVAPFNAQVNRLSERLASRGVPVGTVDKFQGQEAPVVIYSMATSRAEDAPRGMEFLYSPNRLNVATSRARCAAIVVAGPALCEPSCRTPRQMALANALCRFREISRTTER
jgi:predicted RecB family nuclease